jgi:hypothetical protein
MGWVVTSTLLTFERSCRKTTQINSRKKTCYGFLVNFCIKADESQIIQVKFSLENVNHTSTEALDVIVKIG